MSKFNRFPRRGGSRPASAIRPRRLGIEGLEERAVPAGFVAVGTDAGGPAIVRIFADRDGDHKYETLAAAFQPFGPAFKGGVRVAMGDFGRRR